MSELFTITKETYNDYLAYYTHYHIIIQKFLEGTNSQIFPPANSIDFQSKIVQTSFKLTNLQDKEIKNKIKLFMAEYKKIVLSLTIFLKEQLKEEGNLGIEVAKELHKTVESILVPQQK